MNTSSREREREKAQKEERARGGQRKKKKTPRHMGLIDAWRAGLPRKRRGKSEGFFFLFPLGLFLISTWRVFNYYGSPFGFGWTEGGDRVAIRWEGTCVWDPCCQPVTRARSKVMWVHGRSRSSRGVINVRCIYVYVGLDLRGSDRKWKGQMRSETKVSGKESMCVA